MRDSTTLFDRDTDPADELTREFWGDGASWATGHRSRAFQVQRADEPSRALRLDHTPASLRAVRDGIAAFRPTRRWRDEATGPIARTREHGVLRDGPTTDRGRISSPAPIRRRPSPEQLPHRDASIAELAAGRFDDGPPVVRDADLEPTGFMELTPTGDAIADRVGRSGVDPILVRIGIVLLVVLLAIPLALAMRDDANVGTTPVGVAPAGAAVGVSEVVDLGDDDGGADAQIAPTAVAPTDAPSATASATDPATTAGGADGPDSGAVEPSAPAVAQEATAAPVADGATRTALTESIEVVSVDEAATVDATAERAVPDCSLTYAAGAGDSWYRIADAAGVSPSALLDQNRATVDTVIFPGDEICLPAGATVPTAPTTTAAPRTTDAPTTTSAPTTTTATPATTTEVQALIREIWPDELEEKALEIAWRESNYIATADNGWCCVGVFQIYWSVHRSWLDDYGIDTRDDLKDARKNITAAYALYQRSGGWSPWSTA